MMVNCEALPLLFLSILLVHLNKNESTQRNPRVHDPPVNMGLLETSYYKVDYGILTHFTASLEQVAIG